ncbi:MAG: hypothetical protein K8E24_013880, partial [Methanobacterium paludis]|nr:hypothetical protein [Methanobacterium paludis]
GNVQRIIADDYKDFDKAAKDIIAGRSFDNGLICAGDQSCIVQKNDEKTMVDALVKNGAFYSADENTVAKFRNVLFVNGKLNGKIVGKSAEFIANLAGVKVPKDTKIILLKVNRYGAEELLCGEKLCPVTVELTYDTFEEGVDIAKANLLYQGAGHSAGIHSNNRKYIEYAGVTLPVSRLVVNVFGIAAGGAGLATHLNPTPSLGCGSWGGNSISENLTYEHLINISRIAFPRKVSPPTDEEIWN